MYVFLLESSSPPLIYSQQISQTPVVKSTQKKRNSSQQEASAQQLLLVQIRLETSSRLFAHTEIFSVSHKIETATGIQEICLGDRFRWQTCCLWLCLPPSAFLMVPSNLDNLLVECFVQCQGCVVAPSGTLQRSTETHRFRLGQDMCKCECSHTKTHDLRCRSRAAGLRPECCRCGSGYAFFSPLQFDFITGAQTGLHSVCLCSSCAVTASPTYNNKT